MTDQLNAEPIGTHCIDGVPLTALDVEHVQVAELARRRALRDSVYAVAASARDAEECRLVFEMLGIDLDAARSARRSD